MLCVPLVRGNVAYGVLQAIRLEGETPFAADVNCVVDFTNVARDLSK